MACVVPPVRKRDTNGIPLHPPRARRAWFLRSAARLGRRRRAGGGASFAPSFSVPEIPRRHGQGRPTCSSAPPGRGPPPRAIWGRGRNHHCQHEQGRRPLLRRFVGAGLFAHLVAPSRWKLAARGGTAAFSQPIPKIRKNSQAGGTRSQADAKPAPPHPDRVSSECRGRGPNSLLPTVPLRPGPSLLLRLLLRRYLVQPVAQFALVRSQ